MRSSLSLSPPGMICLRPGCTQSAPVPPRHPLCCVPGAPCSCHRLTVPGSPTPRQRRLKQILTTMGNQKMSLEEVGVDLTRVSLARRCVAAPRPAPRGLGGCAQCTSFARLGSARTRPVPPPSVMPRPACGARPADTIVPPGTWRGAVPHQVEDMLESAPYDKDGNFNCTCRLPVLPTRRMWCVPQPSAGRGREGGRGLAGWRFPCVRRLIVCACACPRVFVRHG